MPDSPQNPQNVHLHCAQCDAQLGVFENEWIHLTTSYARPKEKGINMGCRVGARTQVVPNGSAQKEAVGCLMVELFCDKCASIVGQSCKSTPDPDQEYLLNLRFFKLSRIYLKDATADRRADPVFVDANSFDNHSRSASIRSSAAPRPRAPSRNGTTPSFRQSYPPPSSQIQTYEQYPPQHTPMAPPRQYSHQTPAVPSFIHYQPPVNAYAHPQYPPRPQFETTDPFRPTSADGLPNLQQKIDGHTASISECFNRIAAAETRLASDEQRVSDAERRSLDVTEKLQQSEAPVAGLRQRLDQLEKICQSQTTTHAQSHDTIVRQEAVIARQAEQLASVTGKLETLQNSMNELKTQMEDVRSRPVPQPSPRSKKRDFLENMEVMLRAMRGAQSTEREMESLREKNSAIKARLQMIFSAMGSVSEEDAALLEDPLPDQELQESQLLGKRKRPISLDEVGQRKMPRRSSDTSAQDDQALPTPDSTQDGRQSLDVSQTSSTRSQHHATVDEQTSSQSNGIQSSNQEESGVMTVTNQQDTVTPTEQTQADIARAQDNTVILANDTETPAEQVVQETIEPHSARPDTHQAHAVTGNPPRALLPYDNQLAYFPHASSGLRDFHLDAGNTVHQPTPPWSVPRNQHPSLYRPNIGYSRTTSTNSVDSPGNTFAFVNSTMLPPSHVLGPLPGNVDPRLPRWKRDESAEPRTFSDALSRGQRLEDVISRPPRRSSVLPSDGTQQKNKQLAIETVENARSRQSSTLQPQQEPMPSGEKATYQDQTRSNVKDSVEATRNAEAIDFSDEENTVRVVVDSSSTQNKQVPSTTPTGEPHTPRLDRASVARTIRELAQEPLRRPVIRDLEQERRQSAGKGATNHHQRSVLPGFAAAIHNLNDSAARHVAASSPQPSENDMLRRSQGSEPVPRVSAVMNPEQTHVATQRHQSVAPDAQANNEPCSVTVETQGSKCENPSTRPGRGRPRKSQAMNETTSSSAETGLDNDDTCAVCKRRGRLLCCDGCPRSYHHRCLNPPMDSRQAVEGDWFCPSCNTQRQRHNTPSAATPRSRQDESVMIMRRKLAEEALVRDMGKTKAS